MYGGDNMREDNLYIRLEQIPGGVRLLENYTSRFVKCIRQDNMHDSMLILQGLISVIGEINRDTFLKVLYPMLGCSVKTLKKYLFSISENCTGDHLFARGSGQFYDECKVEGSLPLQTGYSYSVCMDPVNSANLELSIKDDVFRHIKSSSAPSRTDPAAITASSFADTLYSELYFPAIKLLTCDETGKAAKAFIDTTVDELFVPRI